MRKFFLEITDEAWEQLAAYAHERRRAPADQASVLLEQALGMRALEHPPVGRPAVNGVPLAVVELENQHAGSGLGGPEPA